MDGVNIGDVEESDRTDDVVLDISERGLSLRRLRDRRCSILDWYPNRRRRPFLYGHRKMETQRHWGQRTQDRNPGALHRSESDCMRDVRGYDLKFGIDADI